MKRANLGFDSTTKRESTILRFRHLLEKHELAAQMLETVNALLSGKGLLLKAGTVVDATLIAAPRVRPRMPVVSETLKCIRPRKETNGTSG